MNKNSDSLLPVVRYTAAGGVVIFKNKVLVLERPSRQEIRLPKGHVEDGEILIDAAIREVREESGYSKLKIIKDLGEQINEFDYDDIHIIRKEHYYLMELEDEDKKLGEEEFNPKWMSWDNAFEQITYSVEKEWVRRAMNIVKNVG